MLEKLAGMMKRLRKKNPSAHSSAAFTRRPKGATHHSVAVPRGRPLVTVARVRVPGELLGEEAPVVVGLRHVLPLAPPPLDPRVERLEEGRRHQLLYVLVLQVPVGDVVGDDEEGVVGVPGVHPAHVVAAVHPRGGHAHGVLQEQPALGVLPAEDKEEQHCIVDDTKRCIVYTGCISKNLTLNKNGRRKKADN